jgi:SSS family solute:Na+ symporter
MYATLVTELLPPGIKGLVIAGLLAALMSSLSSVFNSSATLAVMDFYKKWRPDASEPELVRAGQFSTIALVAIGLLWLPFIGLMSNQLYVYLQSVQAYISPPIAAVFLLGLLWKRANGKGAFATLISGFILGAIRFISELGVKAGWITWKPLVMYASINFLHFAILLFVLSVVILVAVSLRTAAPTRSNLSIFEEADDKLMKPAGSSKVHKRNVAYSMVLAGVVLVFWVIFSPVAFG